MRNFPLKSMYIMLLKTIMFDGDDTLWENEVYFMEAEDAFSKYFPNDTRTSLEYFEKIKISNLELYGFGIKGFILSMIEASNAIAPEDMKVELANRIIELGKTMIHKEVVLIEGVEDTLELLSNKLPLTLVTKGDMIDQKRKFKKSGLQKYFTNIVYMSDKTEIEYHEYIKSINILPHETIMIGNSLRSDVIPILNIGGKAVYIPNKHNWKYEDHPLTENNNFEQLSKFSELKEYFKYL